jgi:hypothetical protein
MDLSEYVYTGGMTAEEVADRLREETAGVLALADGGRAYAVPVSFAWDEPGERLLFRLGDDGDSRKLSVLEATTEASFLLYGVESATDSWSILVTGPVAEVTDLPEGAGEDATGEDDRIDEAWLNEQFGPIRLFDEDVGELEPRLFAMPIEALAGRRTLW